MKNMQAIEYTTNAQNGIITLQLPVKKKEVRIIVIWDNEDENVARLGKHHLLP